MAKQQIVTVDEDMGDTTSKPMDWSKVLFLQIDRINKAMTETQGNFMAGIDALEMDLAFFSENDPQFKKDLEAIDAQAKTWVQKKKNQSGSLDDSKRMTLAYARARELMKALLRLMGRKGFYPEQQGHFRGRS